MDALRIEKAILAGFDWGARTADVIAALWPERCRALVTVSGYIITNREANLQPLPPAAELGWWYQYDRWRLSLAKGEPRYDDLEGKLAQGPAITVQAITIGSDFDGAAADGQGYAKKYTGKHDHRILKGIGHNVPQEAPNEFARAVSDAGRL